MTDRADQIRAFLSKTDWRGAVPQAFTGDASNRRYFRLPGAVLMDAPPDRGEDIRPFVAMTEWLRNAGLSAPDIFAADQEAGFIVLEDLGDAIFARHLEHHSNGEAELYEAAADVLLDIATQEPPELAPYIADTMAPLAALAGTWYAGDATLGTAIDGTIARALRPTDDRFRTAVLRDYHAENLLWLPDRKGVARVGLLDYQDARIGHIAYDLASLVRDARRDVAPHIRAHLGRYISEKAGIDAEEMSYALAVQGAQRNLRILGVFARLSLHFGKPHYIDLIPRVWDHLMADAAHPELGALRAVIRALPPPSDSHLQDLRDRCGTIPTLA